MPDTLLRTNVFLSKDQRAELRALALKRGVSMAALIREAIWLLLQVEAPS